VLALSKKDICVSTGATCSTRDPRPSHILKAIKLNDKAIRGSLRISISRYTTKADIEAFLKALSSIL
ncbi:MAG TPA: aminotransferase class V-fold PLP-dependent enzyme, partial [Candidatus Nanoarchaeia archaeon]|nr:aminotransferase class V-fold PLP-dependent enzyme [Candidatus Nanoarchaeia archaeon]